jgi:hypothetical protein
MLREYLPIPHRAVCITDMPQGITECETFPLWREFENLGSVGYPNCFRRLRLFDPEVQQQIGGEWFLSMDIDCVMLKSIEPLLTPEAPFKIVAGRHARYNGSMWLLQAGAMQNVIRDFHPTNSPKQIMQSRHNGRRLVGSDQAWLTICAGDVPTWSTPDGVMAFMRDRSYGANAGRIWFFAGSVKPWSKECRVRAPVLYAEYQKHYKQ